MQDKLEEDETVDSTGPHSRVDQVAERVDQSDEGLAVKKHGPGKYQQCRWKSEEDQDHLGGGTKGSR